MIETIIIEYLSRQLGICVLTEKPNDKPQRYIIVEKK